MEDDEIFKISKEKDRASDLFEMAKERLEIIKILPRDKSYKIIEEYYEIVKELLTAIMYMDGYKTLSHIKLIEYFSYHYKVLNETEIRLIDNLRKFRIIIGYYGKKLSKDFLINNEDSVKSIINIIIKVVEDKIKKS